MIDKIQLNMLTYQPRQQDVIDEVLLVYFLKVSNNNRTCHKSQLQHSCAQGLHRTCHKLPRQLEFIEINTTAKQIFINIKKKTEEEKKGKRKREGRHVISF